MTLPSFSRVCSIVLVLLPLSAGLAAETAAGKTAAKVLLEKGWNKTAAGKTLVNHPRLEEPPLAGDSSVLAARWLVLMYQSNYDDALAGLEKFLQAEPAEDLKIHALRAKAWILTVKKDYRQAMVVADQLSQAAAPKPQATDKALLEAQNQAVAFVGRLAGFVEGPGETAADQEVRAKLEQRVLARLDQASKEKFNAAKTDVLEEFARLMKQAADATADTKTAAAEVQAKKLAELNEVDAKLAKKANEVEGKGKKLADEVEAKLLELDRMEIPVVQRIDFIESQLRSLNSELARQEDLVRENSSEDDKGASEFTLRAAKHKADSLRRDITLANNYLTIAQARQKEILQARLMLNGNARALGQQLVSEKSKIDGDQAKNAYKKKRADRLKAGTGSKALAIESEARAFSTYDSFPFEELRDALLAKGK